MSSAAKKAFIAARLPGYKGRGDKYLGDIAMDLRRVLWKVQNTFAHPVCRLPDVAWTEVAVLLVEWAEDIHNDLGLWRSIESHQRRSFGTPLPFVGAESAGEMQSFDPRRIQFLLWNLWHCFNPDLVLSPTHPDLKRIAEVAGRFLTERMAGVPRDSGLKQFLSTPNDYGWDVKSKLLWAGINSYMFRFLFFKYLDDNDQREPGIAIKDFFTCQHCTEWGGLGVIDVLAGALDLPESDRTTLKSWYELHTSYFRILASHEDGGEVKTLTARNIVNGEAYTIRMNVADCPFKTGMVVSGALAPWRSEWYWSGEQRIFKDLPESEDVRLRKQMLESASTIAYRYCLAEAEQAREVTRKLHENFVEHHGGDLAVFPDGMAVAAAQQKRLDAGFAVSDSKKGASITGQGVLKSSPPQIRLPPEFLNHKQGIGMFSNPEEGTEFILGFNHVLSGLRKKGGALTQEEVNALQCLVTGAGVSPAFVWRLATEYGAESIAEAFLLRHVPPEWALEFLLRRHKGHFFRKRYPSIALVQSVV